MTEDEWLIHQERKRAALEGAEETRADLARRQQARAEGREREWQLPDPPKPASRAVQPPQPVAQPTMSPADSAAWNKWAEVLVDRKLQSYDKGMQAFADEAGAVCGRLERRIKGIEDRLTASEAAATKRIVGLQKRLKAAEKQAAEPAQPRIMPRAV